VIGRLGLRNGEKRASERKAAGSLFKFRRKINQHLGVVRLGEDEEANDSKSHESMDFFLPERGKKATDTNR
jgi:hypothetical protein